MANCEKRALENSQCRCVPDVHISKNDVMRSCAPAAVNNFFSFLSIHPILMTDCLPAYLTLGPEVLISPVALADGQDMPELLGLRILVATQRAALHHQRFVQRCARKAIAGAGIMQVGIGTGIIEPGRSVVSLNTPVLAMDLPAIVA